jgi:alkyldihydroxyacetonephosphate synthase
VAGDRAQLSLLGLSAELAEIVGAGHVTQAARDLAAAGVSVLPTGAPAWLVRPSSAAEIAQLVRLAGDRGAVVIPVGTATRRPSGRGADRPRIILDVKRMTHVLHLDETSLVVQVQAGLTGLGLEELLLPRGLTIGDVPPAALRSTIGGMLSVRTPGKTSPRQGFIEASVLGLSAVLADGRTVHTRVAPRRATGPDLQRALLGAEGALGVITGATLRIHRRAEARLLDSARFPSLAHAVEAVFAALRRDAQPAAVRIYDAAEARAHLGGDPGGAVLVAGTVGPPELAAIDRDLLAEEGRARGASPLGPGPAEIWWRRRFGHHVPGPTPPPPALEIAAGPMELAAVADAVVRAAAGAGRAARVHIARFDLDGACVFVTLLDGDRPDPFGPARAPVEEQARAAGGQLVGDRDPAFEPYLEALRRELDPRGVFAPALGLP